MYIVHLFLQSRTHYLIERSKEVRRAKEKKESSKMEKNSSCLHRPVSHRLSILQRARMEDVRNEPFPHVIIKNALPEPIYTALERHFLSDTELVAETTGSLAQRMRSNYRYSVKADALVGFKKQSKILIVI